ncbi:chitinase 2 [Ziziphus jujuba]|uniref:Chitinase 2 n=1 Tax=Ziziphus jujuba TaxID=326968 RepID=A0ABM3ZUE3_ZIZJJ|nr:chitinase 2 [Ziziphus jujuba]
MELLFTTLLVTLLSSTPTKSKLFREYIGAESDSIKLSDVPINSNVEFHFILAFAIDYSTGSNPSPTDGIFNAFWESKHITSAKITSTKRNHPNVKLALSLGGDTVGNKKANFAPKSIDSWVQNAIYSLTKMIKLYNIDGIDIDYEHFITDPNTFAECIGRLISNLKKSRTIKFASIAPYDDDDGPVEKHYRALWNKYGHVIDYVNFQFYAYDKPSVSQFVKYFDIQASNYKGGQILASFISGGRQGLGPEDGFFEACKELMGQGKLGGIFVWCADESETYGFKYEKKSQDMLVS